jgi:hypothetical protein
MKKKTAVAAIGLFILGVGQSPTFAQDPSGLLRPEQMRAYHACLFEAWIQDYCRWNSPGYERLQCVSANGGGRYPLDGHWVSEDYCWASAQGLTSR